MAWYYYCGNTPVPVPVKPGASVSVRRGSKVEVLMDSKELQALIREGKLKRTSEPKGQLGADGIKTAEVSIKDVVKKTKFSDTFVELGPVKRPDMVPDAVDSVDGGEVVEAVETKENINDEDLDKDENDSEKEIENNAVLLEDVKGKIGKRRRRQDNTEK